MEDFANVPLPGEEAPDSVETPAAAPEALPAAVPEVADTVAREITPVVADTQPPETAPVVVDAQAPDVIADTVAPEIAPVIADTQAPDVVADTVAPETVPAAVPEVADTQAPNLVADAQAPNLVAEAGDPESVPVVVQAPETVPATPDTETPDDTPKSRKARHKRKRPRNYWFIGFQCGVALAGALAFAGRMWEQRHTSSVDDRFYWNFPQPRSETTRENLEIQIPTWPVGQGPAFTLLREHGDTLSAQDVYRNVNPSVVTVIVGLDEATAAVGTGVIFSPDGYFVTNYHVVQGGTECRAMLDSGHSYEAFYVAGDEQNDLAVLKMDCSDALPAATFGDSELLTVGDDVYAIGNPLGIEFRGTLTNGIISAIDRDVLVDGRTMNLIQTNAELNSGNSGGPLINQYGQVVGINVVKMSSRRSTVEGLGFAIPSATMERLVNDLLTYGESQPEPMIGVSVDSFGTEVEPDLWGIGVLKVERDSPAERAGVQVGDYIIAADSETVSSSRDLLRVRRRYHVGDAMPLTLWRDGERVEVLISFTE